MSFKAAIDSMTFGPGFLMVSGWLAVPRDQPWPDAVQLETASERFTVTHWFARADLPDAEDGPRFLAFREDFAWGLDMPPAADLAMQVGEVVTTTASAGRWTRFTPSGALERATQAGLSGWILDPALWHGTGQAAVVFADGRRLPVSLTLSRPDLTGGVPQPNRRHGFTVTAAVLGRFLAESQPFRPGAAPLLTLESSDQSLAQREAEFSPATQGRIEVYRDQTVRGWAAFPETRWAVPAVEILINGVLYDTVNASNFRKDLQDKGLTTGGGGFALTLRSLPQSGEAVVQARIAGEAELLPGAPLKISDLPLHRSRADGPWRSLARHRPQVSIIIPIYNAAEDLAACLATLVAQTGGDAELIAIDDASPDPRVAEVLAGYEGQRNIRILRNPQNLGFTGTCNRGIAAAGRRDVVLLNSDTLLPARWLENLATAAYASPQTASASPLSDNAGAFSAPRFGGQNALPPGLSPSDLSRLVAQASRSLFPDVPTGHGFCLYLRRDALDAIGPLDVEAFPRGYGEENDLCMRALRAGWQNVVDDRTYVLHRQSASFGASRPALLREGRATLDARYPEYKPLIGVFQKEERQLGMRWRVRAAFAQARPPRPRVLFVISTESGGTPQTNMDLMRGLEDRYEPWLMVCSGSGLVLKRLVDGRLEPVAQRQLDAPIQMSTHRSESYNETVAEWLVLYAIELLHIRHLAWHGLDLPQVGRALGLPVVLSLHDFYIVCPTIKLLDGEMQHCAGRCTVGEGECRAELWPADQVPPLRDRFVHRWRDMMRPALAACDAFVTTSEHARGVIVDSYPELGGQDFRVLAHGRSFASFLAPAARAQASDDQPVRILVPGNISAAKGARLIEAMVALDQGRRVEFHILGDHGVLQAAPGLILHGRYSRENFLDHVEALDVQFGAVLSIWPETYCHTLTELWAAGLPVFALDLGAVGERIRAQGAGWLFDSQDPATLLEALLAAAADLPGVDRRLDELRAWQASEAAGARNIRAMARDYDLLYREVMHRRLAFAAPFTPPQTWLLLDLRWRRQAQAEPLPEALCNRAASRVIFHAVAGLGAATPPPGTAGVLVVADRLQRGMMDELAGYIAQHGLHGVYCSATPPNPASLAPWQGNPRVALGLPQEGGAGWPLPVLDTSLHPLVFQERLAGFAGAPPVAAAAVEEPMLRRVAGATGERAQETPRRQRVLINLH